MKTKHLLLTLIPFLFSTTGLTDNTASENKEPIKKGSTDTPKSPRNAANKILGLPMKGEDSGKNKLLNAADSLLKTKKGKAEENKAAADEKKENK